MRKAGYNVPKIIIPIKLANYMGRGFFPRTGPINLQLIHYRYVRVGKSCGKSCGKRWFQRKRD